MELNPSPSLSWYHHNDHSDTELYTPLGHGESASADGLYSRLGQTSTYDRIHVDNEDDEKVEPAELEKLMAVGYVPGRRWSVSDYINIPGRVSETIVDDLVDFQPTVIPQGNEEDAIYYSSVLESLNEAGTQFDRKHLQPEPVDMYVVVSSLILQDNITLSDKNQTRMLLSVFLLFCCPNSCMFLTTFS